MKPEYNINPIAGSTKRYKHRKQRKNMYAMITSVESMLENEPNNESSIIVGCLYNNTC